MRLLFLIPYPPYPPHSGGALRIYNLLLHLAKRHDVWALVLVPDAAAEAALEPLREWCHVVTVQSVVQRSLSQRALTTLSSPLPDMAFRNALPSYQTALDTLLREHTFDVVQAESIEMSGYALHLANGTAMDGQRKPMLVLDEFNAEYVLQRRAALTRPYTINPQSLLAIPYSLVQWAKLARYERHLLRTFDHVLAVSEDDRNALLRLEPQSHIDVVPNGVDTTYFSWQQEHVVRQATRLARGSTLVFTGTMDFRPNVDAVMWFVQAVLPLVRLQHTEARFVVVGRNPVPDIQRLHDGAAVEIVGEVSDVRPYIALADVYVLPMRIGGGVRLKFLEALSMESAVVSTKMGAEGIRGLQDGVHYLLADSPDAFARAILRLFDDAATGRQLGMAGRKLVCEQYEWEAIVPLLEQVYLAIER